MILAPSKEKLYINYKETHRLEGVVDLPLNRLVDYITYIRDLKEIYNRI